MVTLSTVNTAMNGAAWKTASMSGYIKKTTLDAETYGTGAYKLTFVNKAGDAYDFYFNVDSTASATAAAVEDADDLILDSELLGHILNATWNSGTAEAYEAARDPSSGTW